MQLLTKELLKKLPKLYEVEQQKDPLVQCHYFLPMTQWNWFVLEFDGKNEFFGYVTGECPELGYFTLDELRTLKGPFGMQVERDLYFSPVPLSKIKKEVRGVYATV